MTRCKCGRPIGEPEEGIPWKCYVDAASLKPGQAYLVSRDGSTTAVQEVSVKEGHWTTDPPEEEGWYAVKHGESAHPEVVEFFYSRGRLYAGLMIWYDTGGPGDHNSGAQQWDGLVDEYGATRHTTRIELPEQP